MFWFKVEPFRAPKVLAYSQHAPTIEPKQDRNHGCKGPKGGTSIANQGEGYPNDRQEPQGHADIDRYVQKQNATDTVAIDPAKGPRLAFGNLKNPNQQKSKQGQEQGTAPKSVFFRDGT
ncbi:MAG: hypothetical protein RLZZ121_831, partial [Bacteroidota bacterium]